LGQLDNKSVSSASSAEEKSASLPNAAEKLPSIINSASIAGLLYTHGQGLTTMGGFFLSTQTGKVSGVGPTLAPSDL
jgi:hypothetical protein